MRQRKLLHWEPLVNNHGRFSFVTMIPASTSFLMAAAINHLLSAEPWARRALLPHAGKTAAVDAGLAILRITVAADGLLKPAEAADPADPVDKADVTIHVKPADLPLILRNRAHAFSYVTVEGDAGFAATLSQLAESLRWEAEEDLARIVGDIAAVRIIAGARQAANSIDTARQTLGENIAEYLADEKPVLVRPAMLRGLADDVTRLRDDVERLAKRIERLKRGAGQ